MYVLYVCMYVCTYVCMNVGMYVCTYVGRNDDSLGETQDTALSGSIVGLSGVTDLTNHGGDVDDTATTLT